MLAPLLALFSVLLAGVYFLVGRVVLARRPTGDGRPAATSFAVWWFTLAALTSGGMVDYIVRNTVHWTLATFLAYTQLLLLTIVIAVGALLYYLVYLFTGRRQAWQPIAVGYILFYIAILYYFAIAEPVAVVEGDLRTKMRYDNDLTDSALATVLGTLLVAPPLLAAIGYFSLFFRVPERSQRFRIGAVGGAFIIWFGATLVVGQLTDWSETTSWRIASQVIALGAASLVYIAFRPPTWLRQRYRISGFGEHVR